jgi:integrase
MPLTDAACRAAKPETRLKKLSDGGGLQLWVQPTGSRLWRLAYRFDGRQKLLSLGAYPEVSLAEARERRDVARRQLRDGIDPSEAKKQAKRARAAQATFEQVAGEYIAKLTREGRAPATLDKAVWILGFAKRPFGNQPLPDISAADVLSAARLIEAQGNYDKANRFKTTVGAVFRYGIMTGRTINDPTLALRGALTRHRPKHRAAVIDPQALGPLLRAIDGYQGHAAVGAALKLLPLLSARPGELRAAEWSEFDFGAQVWTVPASRMKTRCAHKVPLAPQAQHILLSLRAMKFSDRFVFPSVRVPTKPISDGTMNAALRSLGYPMVA